MQRLNKLLLSLMIVFNSVVTPAIALEIPDKNPVATHETLLPRDKNTEQTVQPPEEVEDVISSAQPAGDETEVDINSPTPEIIVTPSEQPDARETVKPEDTEMPAETLVPEGTTVPSEEPVIPEQTPEASVKPTEVPESVPSVEPTIEPSVEPTIEPTVEPTVEPTTEPTVEPTVMPSETPEDTDVPETEKPITEFAEGFAVSDAKAISDRIADGESLVVFIGRGGDETFNEVLKAYRTVFENLDDEAKSDFVQLNESDINAESLSLIASYAYRSEDKDAINGLADGGHAVIYTFNSTINSVNNYDTLYQDFTYEYVASIDYRVSHYKREFYNTTDVVMFSNRALDLGASVGDTWSYGAKGAIQTFTAPVSGYYTVELWGADGDSDTGVGTQGVNAGKFPYTTGVGGEASTVTGDIFLKEGETIYLGLGFRSGFNLKTTYNGGGAGAPGAYGFRSGGGGAGAVYSTEKGRGEIVDYANNKGDILMVAGGGGGAEDFYATGLEWNAPYYCLRNYCEPSYGGNGGTVGQTGRGSGPNGVTGKYLFGVGEKYGSYENSSAGGGGGGYFGGTSPYDNSQILKGGTGGGGSSYVNESRITNATIKNGDGINFTHLSPIDGYDDGRNAGAIITFKAVAKHPLTIHYVSEIDGSTLAPDYHGEYDYGSDYSVESPVIPGYTCVDLNHYVVKGTMPDAPVEITVYYSYPKVVINYLDQETNKPVAKQVIEKMKAGTDYSYKSPNVDGYVFFEDGPDVIAGKKTNVDEIFNVYYVRKFSPVKNIIAVDNRPVSKAESDKGVQLKVGDVVTYEIEYRNRRNIPVNETIVDTLPNTLRYVNGSAQPVQPSVSGQKLTWNVNVPAVTTQKITFKAQVVNSNDGATSVNNWTRKDPLVSYEVIKSATPESGTHAGYNQEITYNLLVKNTGKNTVNNILVIDKIPEGTAFAWVNRNHHGSYVSNGNYVRFVIDELVPDQIAKLQFKVKITKQISDSSEFIVRNTAKFENYPSHIDGGSSPNLDKDVIDNGENSNEVIHRVVGPKIDINKTSNPTNGTTVKAGDTITYNVKLTNTGSVKSNFLRVVDKIPDGTSYINGSLGFSTDNINSDNKYAVNYGENFDIYYDKINKQYRIDNVKDTNNIHQIIVEWGNSISLDMNSLGGKGTIEGNKVLYAKSNNLYDPSSVQAFSQQEIRDFLYGLRFNGNYLSDDQIKITFNTLIIDEIGADLSSASRSWARLNDTGTWYSDSTRIWNTQNTGHPTGFYNPNKNYAQMNFSVDVTTTNAEGDNDYMGIMFKTKPDSTTGNTSSYIFALAGNLSDKPFGGLYDSGLYYIENSAFTNDGAFHKIAGANPTVYWSEGNYKNIKVVTSGDRGDHIQIYVNGTKVIDLIDSRFISGSVGFWAYSQSNASFRSIKGSAGYYQTSTVFTTSLPKNDNSAGCKYITTNGKPYVECVTSDIEVGKSATMSFTVKVNNPIPSGLTAIKNTALYETLWSDPGMAGTKTQMPDKPSNTTIHPLSGKAPTITAVKSSIVPTNSLVNRGETITYLIDVTNTGSATAEYSVVREYLPESVSYKSGTVSDNGAYISADKPYVEWVLRDLKPGQTKRVEYKVVVKQDADYNKDIICAANYELYFENPGVPGTIDKEPVSITNQTRHYLKSSLPGEQLNLEVVKSADKDPAKMITRETDIQYTIQVSNKSQKASMNYMAVKDLVPEGTTLKSVDKYEGGELSPNLIVESTTKDTHTNYVEWAISNLVAGDTVKLKFTVTVDKETTLDTIKNKAIYVTNDNNPYKPGTTTDKDYNGHNETNEVHHNLIRPEIKVVKESTPATNNVLAHGKTITYRLIVTNISEALANYSNIEDLIPQETTYVEGSLKLITDNKSDKAKYNEKTNSIQCVMYDLKPNEERTIEFKVKIKDDVRMGDEIRNIAQYDTSITNKGEPDNDNFVPPTTNTNEVVHVVEVTGAILPTGGSGWSLLVPAIGICMIAAAVVVMNKKKQQ